LLHSQEKLKDSNKIIMNAALAALELFINNRLVCGKIQNSLIA